MLKNMSIKVKSLINLINIIVLLYYTTGLDLLYKVNLGWITTGMRIVVYIMFIISLIYILKKIYYGNSKILLKNKELLMFVFFVLIISMISLRGSVHSNIQAILLIGTAIYAIYLVSFYSYEEIFSLIYKAQTIILIFTIIFTIAKPEYGKMYYQGQMVWRGGFVHKNLLGANIAFNILLLLSIYKINNSKVSKALKSINIGISTIILILTSSTTSILIVIIPIIIFKIYTITKVKINVSYILILINIIAYNVTQNKEKYNELFIKLFKKDLTLTGRTRVWAAIIEVIKSKPFTGYGYRNLWANDSEIAMSIRSTVGFNVTGSHNGFLEWMLQIGIVGVIFLTYIFIITGRRVMKIFNINKLISKFSIQYLVYILTFYITERASNPMSYQILMLFIVITLVNDCYYKNKKIL